MECPNCKYSYKLSDEIFGNETGKFGPFYSSNLFMERDIGEDKVYLVGCPSCGIVFLNR